MVVFCDLLGTLYAPVSQIVHVKAYHLVFDPLGNGVGVTSSKCIVILSLPTFTDVI